MRRSGAPPLPDCNQERADEGDEYSREPTGGMLILHGDAPRVASFDREFLLPNVSHIPACTKADCGAMVRQPRRGYHQRATAFKKFEKCEFLLSERGVESPNGILQIERGW